MGDTTRPLGTSRIVRWGLLVARRHRWVLAGWLALFAVMVVFSAQTSEHLAPGSFNANTQAERALSLVQREFPARRDAVLTVVLHSDATPAADPGYAAQVRAWRGDLVRLSAPEGVSVSPPQVGRDGRTVALVMASSRQPDAHLALARAVRALHHDGPATADVGGIAMVYETFITESQKDLDTSERISLPVALLLLLVVFGGLVAAGLPVITGLATVVVAVALLGFVARVHGVSVFALNVTSVVGLGLGIDYSLLVVNRFRDELHAGRSVEDAVAMTVRTAGLATVVSGGTVMIGFGALLLSPINALWSIGLGGALVVGVSVLASLTLIPALLTVFGTRVDRFALPLPRGRTVRFWHRLATTVMRRPVLFILASLALVGLLVAPALSLNPGVVGAESLPPGDPVRTADHLMQTQLGTPAYSPILLVAQGVGSVAAAARLEQRAHDISGQPVVGPASVDAQQRPLWLTARGTALVEIAQPRPDNDEATRHLVDRLHSATWPAGMHVLVGGEAAEYADFLAVLGSNLPMILGIVLGLTLLLLGIVFRSVLLPVKAVLMNLLSVAAALGVLTFVFQQGHLASQLDFVAVGFVDATVPLIIFAALFGLSMDYEVFLLARIREEWTHSGDNRDAVAQGMARTGQIITSAALIMVLVFSALAFSRLAINKSFGVTFATAILVDATVIRLLLVPAFMRVMGHLNWWPARRIARRGAEFAG
jgi:trehalose monomycolate/heme transporter